MKIRNIFKSSEDKDSIGNYFRNKRFDFFFNKIESLSKPVSILDLGGKINFWENRGLSGNKNFQITIINLTLETSPYSNIETKIGNVLELKNFKNNSFDIVFSNSVIEHLYTFENQKKNGQRSIKDWKKTHYSNPK